MLSWEKPYNSNPFKAQQNQSIRKTQFYKHIKETIIDSLEKFKPQ